ncbi:MAG: DUF86 domain-containing protein [Actinomycetota bacterium]|nr:DUF86 domain-containing protein [Actinomycetota bacterium]MDD5667395.1 DUF86 domain-containing protein [Actinomycetota bacterium]
MRIETKKYLYDINQAADLIATFTEGSSFESYMEDSMVRSAVERQFEIIGEALTQLARLDAAVAERITDHRRIIAFRNLLIHGYAEVDNRLVWDIVQSNLPMLRREMANLLQER